MKQMKPRKRMMTGFMVFILFAFLAVDVEFGQAQALRIEVPFQFTVGSKVLPAGAYAFSTNQFGLVVQAHSGESFYVRVMTRLSKPANSLRKGSLIFDNTNSSYILSEVWIPGKEGLLLYAAQKNPSS